MAQFRARVSVDYRDHETITVGTTSVQLTDSKIHPAGQPKMEYVLITVEVDQIRFYVDGTAADANGHLANVNDVIELEGSNNVSGFRAIRVTNNATLRVSYAR